MKVKHEWIVSGKDMYGEFSLKYCTREESRHVRRNFLDDRFKVFDVEYVNPITHRVYQLVKEEKVS